SIAAVAGFALANIDTGFKSNIITTLPPDGIPNDRAPTMSAANSTMNQIKEMLGAQLEFTPFTGKYSLFGKLFAHYDFYAFVGPGLLNYAATTSGTPSCGDSGSMNALTGCAVTGFKLGANVGAGVHSVVNQFLALNLEVRDIFAPNNAAGRDVNGDMSVDNNDL